jgi:shikimate dehydrogenase
VRQPGRLVLVGHPVAHSLSPAFQNAALRRAGIPLVYEALDVRADSLLATMQGLVADRGAGNVTIPYKPSVRELCGAVTPIAERVGAVNTFWTEDGALHGDNTDVGGFTAAVIAELGNVPRGDMVVFGAGGTAAAVCAAAEQWGMPVRIVSRSAERASDLAKRFASVAAVATDVRDALANSALVVNATPLGMRDTDALPVEIEAIPRGALIVDVVYRRGGTAWVRSARQEGIAAIDGLGMLVEQGALAFERWFGFAPDRDAMWNAVS